MRILAKGNSMRKAALACVSIVLVSMAGALAYAPYLPQLLLEGVQR